MSRLGALVALALLLAGCAAAPQPEVARIEHQKKLQQEDAEKDRALYAHVKKQQDAVREMGDLTTKCILPESSPDECANLFIAYRQKYESFKDSIYKHIVRNVSVFLARYCYEAERYNESIQEARKYMDSAKPDDNSLPHVLLYKALSHEKLGEREEALYLLRYVLETYPLSRAAEKIRHSRISTTP
jgi:tetratricopeptide (TPR) repeat protein